MQTIPIFLASDDKYSPFVATTVASVVSNTNSYVNFFILDGGISDENREKINELRNKFANFSIEYIEMKKFGLEKFPEIKHYSLNTFSRYFIPELKPDLNKVLYLDVDIIVKEDVAELYNQDLRHYPLGAVLEDFYPHNYSYLKTICPEYDGGSNYFNAGVLLLNLDYFRKNNMTEKLIDKTLELKDVLNCADQDVFNLLFANNFKILDYKFNIMPDHKDYILKLGKIDAIEALKCPSIIHYTATKPWIDINTKMAIDFWEVAKMTSFYQMLKRTFLKNTPMSLPELKKKYIKYKILSKIHLGAKRAKHKLKALDLKEALSIMKTIVEDK